MPSEGDVRALPEDDIYGTYPEKEKRALPKKQCSLVRAHSVVAPTQIMVTQEERVAGLRFSFRESRNRS